MNDTSNYISDFVQAVEGFLQEHGYDTYRCGMVIQVTLYYQRRSNTTIGERTHTEVYVYVYPDKLLVDGGNPRRLNELQPLDVPLLDVPIAHPKAFDKLLDTLHNYSSRLG
jgi:hypothetical protein